MAVPTHAAIAYSQFKQLIAHCSIEHVTFSGAEISAAPGKADVVQPAGISVSRITTRIPAIGDPELLPLLEQYGIEIEVLPGD